MKKQINRFKKESKWSQANIIFLALLILLLIFYAVAVMIAVVTDRMSVIGRITTIVQSLYSLIIMVIAITTLGEPFSTVIKNIKNKRTFYHPTLRAIDIMRYGYEYSIERQLVFIKNVYSPAVIKQLSVTKNNKITIKDLLARRAFILEKTRNSDNLKTIVAALVLLIISPIFPNILDSETPQLLSFIAMILAAVSLFAIYVGLELETDNGLIKYEVQHIDMAIQQIAEENDTGFDLYKEILAAIMHNALNLEKEKISDEKSLREIEEAIKRNLEEDLSIEQLEDAKTLIKITKNSMVKRIEACNLEILKRDKRR